MLWNRLKASSQRRFRLQRAQAIRARFPEIEGSTIVDLGGSLPFWQIAGDILRPRKVIIYNISSHSIELGLVNSWDYVEMHLYDGKRIPLDDKSAAFVLCNSVIEHVPPESREGLAAEIMRVGRNYIVQTPSPKFPIELHFGLPFVHWLPRPLGRKLVRVSPFHLFSDADAQAYFDSTHLLSQAELQGYFPDGEIVVEKALGMPKSQLVFG